MGVFPGLSVYISYQKIRVLENITSIDWDSLIYRHLAGISSPEDECLLEKWLSSSQEHRDFYLQMKSVWTICNTLKSETLQQDSIRMLARLNARIDAEETAKKNLRRRKKACRRWWWGAAAAAICAIVSLFTLNNGPEEPQADRYITFRNDKDEIMPVILQDSTKVWLAQGARVEWNISTQDRRVVRFSGNAYFCVAKDTLKPFVLTTKDVKVEVLGTTFSVESPAEGQTTSVVLESGSVRLKSLEDVNLVLLKPDQKAICGSGGVSIEKIAATAHVVGKYNNISLSDVTVDYLIMHTREMYGVTIAPKGKYDQMKRYDINYKRTDSAENVLEIIETVTKTDFEIR